MPPTLCLPSNIYEKTSWRSDPLCIHLCISKDYQLALDSQQLFAELDEGTTLQATAEEVRQAGSLQFDELSRMPQVCMIVIFVVVLLQHIGGDNF